MLSRQTQAWKKEMERGTKGDREVGKEASFVIKIFCRGKTGHLLTLLIQQDENGCGMRCARLRHQRERFGKRENGESPEYSRKCYIVPILNLVSSGAALHD